MLSYNKNLKKYSQELRGNMTDAEKLLWSKLKFKQAKGLQFYRQKVIGNYIVDFYCAKVNLVIEVDGGQHYTDSGKKSDEIRDRYLNGAGLKVLRFSDSDVLRNIDGVIAEIFRYL
jgi:very-short-patch-repair endonuclease